MKKVMFFFGILVSLLFINTAFAQSQLDCFLQMGSIIGESKDSQHHRYMDILSFSYGAGKSGGGELTITKLLDSSSHEIRNWLINAKFDRSILSCVARSTTRQEVLRGTMQTSSVTKYKLSVQNAIPLDEFVLSFPKIEWQYSKTGITASVKGIQRQTIERPIIRR